MAPSTALTTSGREEPGAREQDRAVRNLTRLMEEIAQVRAEVLRRRTAAADLQRRLQTELAPLEEQLIRTRLETFRALGRHLREGRLARKSRALLREALRALAEELELDYGLDLREDRRIYLGTEAEDPSGEDVGFYRGSVRGHAADDDLDGEGGPDHSYYSEDPEDGGAGPRGRKGRKGAGDRKGEAGGREKTGKAERPGSKAAQRRAEKDQAMAGDLRALYLLLARALHPDKEGNPALREAKTTWMQKVTTAYANKDLAMLLDILVRNPLEAVGPYLSQAPLKTVQGFAKRLRRELAALRKQAEKADDWLHPFFARFLKGSAIDEAGVVRHLSGLRKSVKLAKQRLNVYRTLEGAEELAEGLKRYHWRDLL
jgi:hypothetical protein